MRLELFCPLFPLRLTRAAAALHARYEPYFAVDKTKWRGVRGPGMFDFNFVRWGGDKAELAMEAAVRIYPIILRRVWY